MLGVGGDVKPFKHQGQAVIMLLTYRLVKDVSPKGKVTVVADAATLEPVVRTLSSLNRGINGK